MRAPTMDLDHVPRAVVLIAATFVAASCSGHTDSTPECLDGPCHARCVDEGHSEGGYCRDGACRCVDGPGADADVGDGDAVDDADTEPAPPRPDECPPPMVEIPGVGWCIDPYECFIDETGRAISVAGAAPTLEVYPDVAEAACREIGKTLCPEDVWMAACTAGGTRTFPYGNTYDPDACNTRDVTPERYMPAGSMPDCEGGYEGIFDMSGNAWELTVGETDPSGDVRYRAHGGDASSNDENANCATDPHVNGGMQGLGFRCCVQLAD